MYTYVYVCAYIYIYMYYILLSLKGLHIYMNIYIYMCVCVCLCMNTSAKIWNLKGLFWTVRHISKDFLDCHFVYSGLHSLKFYSHSANISHQ